MTTLIPDNSRNQKAFVYGTALWFICKEVTQAKQLVALSQAFRMCNSIHYSFVDGGVIEKVGYGMFKSVNQTSPSFETCVKCYDAQTQKMNKSKTKSQPNQELFIQEPPSNQELTLESLAQQVLTLTEIMTKLVTQTQNP
jgi:hypothetical protein